MKIQESPVRNNLFLRVVEVSNNAQYIKRWLLIYGNKQGLIFVNTIKEAKKLFDFLTCEKSSTNDQRTDFSIQIYHGKLDEKTRTKV